MALGILAATNFAGMLCMAFVPETIGRSLEDLSGEEGPDELRSEDKEGNLATCTSHPVSIAV